MLPSLILFLGPTGGIILFVLEHQARTRFSQDSGEPETRECL